MFKHRRPRRRHLFGVPRGVLFYIVLKSVKDRSMSGTELMEEIEEVTGWRPSPGSIYPLLAKLRRENSIEQVETEDPGLKCFTLTDRGKEEFEKHKKQIDLFKERYHSIRRIYLKLIKEMNENLYQANVKLFDLIEEIDPILREKKEAADKVQLILNQATEEIEEIKRQLKNEQ